MQVCVLSIPTEYGEWGGGGGGGGGIIGLTKDKSQLSKKEKNSMVILSTLTGTNKTTATNNNIRGVLTGHIRLICVVPKEMPDIITITVTTVKLIAHF